MHYFVAELLKLIKQYSCLKLIGNKVNDIAPLPLKPIPAVGWAHVPLRLKHVFRKSSTEKVRVGSEMFLQGQIQDQLVAFWKVPCIS